jgi:hypothetical protein
MLRCELTTPIKSISPWFEELASDHFPADLFIESD